MRHVLIAAALLALVAAPAAAQQTRRAAPGAPPPPATVEQLAWLAGSWMGEAMGGPVTETYSAPLGGRITGHFVLGDGKGGVVFSELVDYVPEQGSIVYRVRHFGPDMAGWEDKTGQPVRFPLVAVEGGKWFFDGMTLERTGADALTMWVNIDGRDTPFRFTRSPPAR